MKLAWMFCLLLAGKLSTASPGEESAVDVNGGSSYMMAFPMDEEDQVAEESQVAEAAVKMLADTLADDDDDDNDDKKDDEQEVKKEEEPTTEETPEPMGILQAELAAEDAAEQKPLRPQRPFFKRPKIEELRKILGFPPPEVTATKSKPLPTPKVFGGVFNKPLGPKEEPRQLKMETERSPSGGLQINLRREDVMRQIGYSMLRRDENRPFGGIPDLMQAASTFLRRAIHDDEPNENDISKDDKDEDNNDNDDDDDDESLVIVPIPDNLKNNQERTPLFRRIPIPFPFPVPKPMPAPQSRPRLPFPPIAPVAFFLPIAQQIMQNIRQSQPRSMQPPMMPHFMPPQQQMMHVPMQQPQQMMHVPMQQSQQMLPFMLPQGSVHVPITLVPHPQRPLMSQRMARRMPLHAPQPQAQRRVPFPAPMARMVAPQQQPQFFGPMMHQPSRPMHQVVRPPMQGPMMHPVLFMMPMPNGPQMPFTHQVPMAQQQVPVFHRAPQHLVPQMPMMHHQVPFVHPMAQSRQYHPQEEDRVIFLHPQGGPQGHPEEMDDDQEVLILVPSEDVEVAQRPPFFQPPQMMRQMPTPVADPLMRIRLLRDLLMARQANRQPQMTPAQNRASRVVEIVQQQLRIFPSQHQQQVMFHQQQRPEPSELHPVYVPYPGSQ